MSLLAVTSPPDKLLGRHVGGRAGADRFARCASQAEVGDADLARRVEHHVGGLEVAMDDAAFVRGGEARADLARDLERAIFRESADAAQQRREILAVDVLHREERRAVDLVDVVHAADVGVRHLPRHADFGVELRQPRRIAVDVGRQKLQRDRLAELQVVGAVHLAHAAAADAFDDAVAAAEERAGLEASVIDRPGAREPAGGGRAAAGAGAGARPGAPRSLGGLASGRRLRQLIEVGRPSSSRSRRGGAACGTVDRRRRPLAVRRPPRRRGRR